MSLREKNQEMRIAVLWVLLAGSLLLNGFQVWTFVLSSGVPSRPVAGVHVR